MVSLFLTWAIPFFCGGIASAVLALVTRIGKRERAERLGMQCLLREEIIRGHEKFSRLGYCPVYAKEALKKEYAAYHDLGGNDVASKLYEDVLRLPEEGKA